MDINDWSLSTLICFVLQRFWILAVAGTSLLVFQPYEITSHDDPHFFLFVAFKDWHFKLCIRHRF